MPQRLVPSLPRLALAGLLAVVVSVVPGCLDTDPTGKTFLCDPASGADCKGSGSSASSTGAAAGSSGASAGSTGTLSGTSTGSAGAASSTSAATSTGSAGATATGTTGSAGSTGAAGTSSAGSTGSGGTTGYTNLEIVGTVSTGTLIDADVLDDGTLLGLAGNQIFQFDAIGAASVYAGQFGGGDVDGPRAQARFYAPNGLTHLGPVIYVSEYQSNLVRIIDANGNVGPYAGSGSACAADGAASLACFSSPEGMAVDAAGNLLVADVDNHHIRKIVASGPTVQTVAGTSQGYAEGSALGAAQFNFPRAVAAAAGGVVYVADSENHRIRKVAGGTVSTLGQVPGRPFGVAVDAAGFVYATDIDNAAIYRFDPAGGRLLVVQGGSVANPRAIKVDPQGRLLVANTGNQNVLRITLP